MPLPHIDFELAYWRLRRRMQRVRASCRAWASHARTQAHLQYLHQFGRMPERPEPEETTIYRALWVLSVLGLLAVIAIDSLGDGTFNDYTDAVLAKAKETSEQVTLQIEAPKKADIDMAKQTTPGRRT